MILLAALAALSLGNVGEARAANCLKQFTCRIGGDCRLPCFEQQTQADTPIDLHQADPARQPEPSGPPAQNTPPPPEYFAEPGVAKPTSPAVTKKAGRSDAKRRSRAAGFKPKPSLPRLPKPPTKAAVAAPPAKPAVAAPPPKAVVAVPQAKPVVPVPLAKPVAALPPAKAIAPASPAKKAVAAQPEATARHKTPLMAAGMRALDPFATFRMAHPASLAPIGGGGVVAFADPAVTRNRYRIRPQDVTRKPVVAKAAEVPHVDLAGVGKSLDQLGFSIEGAKPSAADVLDGPVQPAPAAEPTSAASRGKSTRKTRNFKPALDAVPTDQPVDLFADPNPSAAAPMPSKVPPAHPKIFDVSEGTKLDPLKNHSYDLNSGKDIPADMAH